MLRVKSGNVKRQTTLNMGLYGRERPLSSQLRNFHCPEEGGRPSKLVEDHPFGDAPLVGECRQEEEEEGHFTSEGTKKLIIIFYRTVISSYLFKIII